MPSARPPSISTPTRRIDEDGPQALILKALLLPALLLLAVPAVCEPAVPAAAAEPHFPALTGRVVDQAGLLSAPQQAELSAQSEALEKQVGPQFVVVTLRSLEGFPIDAYGRRLGNRWGIGSKARNDGLLLIVAPNEHKVRIEVGRGLESRVTNGFAREVIDDTILPRFRKNEFAEGIKAGASRLVAHLRSKA
jgi:uncharacterized protein